MAYAHCNEADVRSRANQMLPADGPPPEVVAEMTCNVQLSCHVDGKAAVPSDPMTPLNLDPFEGIQPGGSRFVGLVA